ncbi:MAG: hypothetical protein CVU78_08105 [Elusimicrobia bacterium HGW-Elusimicrobia-2]|nr:MAG: hypothetical protein CVU78_08105 [Elusimicrobia bacterium HGW-Elusimicrobia-2]
MACFIVPMAEAIVTSVAQKVVKKREGKKTENAGLSWSRRLGWLNTMLWGGVILLALEHIWHGEVTPWPPFLTALKNPSEVAPMLHEMATVGTAMSVTVTSIWAIMVTAVELVNRAINGAKMAIVREAE